MHPCPPLLFSFPSCGGKTVYKFVKGVNQMKPSMTSMHRVVLAILGVAFFLVTPSVAQTQSLTQTSALSSGKTDQQGWPIPLWWRRYRIQFGTLVSVSFSVRVRVKVWFRWVEMTTVSSWFSCRSIQNTKQRYSYSFFTSIIYWYMILQGRKNYWNASSLGPLCLPQVMLVQ
jgi:hypothetical protein